MISASKLEANRLNAQKSTGPRTAEGKSRSRFNAAKHGATAQTPALPGEDPAAFQARVDGYKTHFTPRSDLENDLIERMALMSAQFDRANRFDAARMTGNMMTGPTLDAHALELEADSSCAKTARPRNSTASGWWRRTWAPRREPSNLGKTNPSLPTPVLSRTKPRPATEARVTRSNPPQRMGQAVHKINSRTAFEIMGTNPAMTSSRIFKTKPPSTIEIVTENAGLALSMKHRRTDRSSGFR